MSEPVYLDNNASTPLLPSVRAKMAEALEFSFANPSSQHRLGVECAQRLEGARAQIGEFLGVTCAANIHFTSGATDAIQRCFDDAAPAAEQVVITAAEHTAVQSAASNAALGGKPIIFVSLDEEGRLNLGELERAVGGAKSFVSIAFVNGETGVITDLGSVSQICRRVGATLHIDASQAVGRVELDLSRLAVDYATMSPHKFHGPKGVGILYAKSARNLERSGTPNVAGVLGAAAATEALADWRNDIRAIAAMRDRLEHSLSSSIQGATVNGSVHERVANTSNIFFPRRNAADMVAALSRRNVFVSAGAACTTGGEPSPVLRAMGLGRDRANASLRFSLSMLTSPADIDYAIEQTIDAFRSTLPTQQQL